MEIFTHTFQHTIKITLFVLAMMVLVDLINMWTRGRLTSIVKGGIWRQYIGASFLGATPGCLGAFMNVTLYVHGLLTFGAIVGGMIATSGDEAFIMLKEFPLTALFLFGLLFIFGIVFAWLTDKIAPLFGIEPCLECELHEYHPGQESFQHYFKDHFWLHIVKKHIWRVFLWTFFALLVIEVGFNYWNLKDFISNNIFLVLILSGLVAIVPESGPNIIFIMMYSKGVIPFSVLLTNCFIQDGHGMLPMLSYSIRDSVLIKIFNFVFGISVGIILYLLGW